MNSTELLPPQMDNIVVNFQVKVQVISIMHVVDKFQSNRSKLVAHPSRTTLILYLLVTAA